MDPEKICGFTNIFMVNYITALVSEIVFLRINVARCTLNRNIYKYIFNSCNLLIVIYLLFPYLCLIILIKIFSHLHLSSKHIKIYVIVNNSSLKNKFKIKYYQLRSKSFIGDRFCCQPPNEKKAIFS